MGDVRKAKRATIPENRELSVSGTVLEMMAVEEMVIQWAVAL